MRLDSLRAPADMAEVLAHPLVVDPITLPRPVPLLSSSMVAPCQSGLVERLATPT